MPKSKEVLSSTSGSDSDSEVETKVSKEEEGQRSRKARQKTQDWRELQARGLVQVRRRSRGQHVPDRKDAVRERPGLQREGSDRHQRVLDEPGRRDEAGEERDLSEPGTVEPAERPDIRNRRGHQENMSVPVRLFL